MPTSPGRPRARTAFPFERTCALLHQALAGPLRRQVVADVSGARNLGGALRQLRDSMRAHVWRSGATHVDLNRPIHAYDVLTREEGFHVLNDWDGIADHVNEDNIPVDVLHYLAEKQGDEPVNETSLLILIDYYFMHLLSLLALRVWDEGDADENLGRLDALLEALQGPGGSGQPFVADTETLILIATAHYERKEEGYEILLERTRTLSAAATAEDRGRARRQHGKPSPVRIRSDLCEGYGQDPGRQRGRLSVALLRARDGDARVHADARGGNPRTRGGTSLSRR